MSKENSSSNLAHSVIPVILSGGSGSRLWPLSRESYPKQLLRLVGQNSLLQDTAIRAKSVTPEKIIMICNEAHRFLIAAQLQEIGLEAPHIILEPMGKNTAPAIAISAFYALAHCTQENPLLLVLPADHVIRDIHYFTEAVHLGEPYAKQGKLVTFGVVPHKPETGFGYIEGGASLSSQAEVRQVARFVEKPDLETAKAYVASGDHYWNSGIFMFQAKAYLDALEKHSPDIFSICKKAFEKTLEELDFCRLDPGIFNQCPSDSIDYAVMEKADNVVVVPMEAGWSDMGCWTAMSEISDADAQGNVIKGNVHIEQVSNCYLHSETRLLAAVGVEDHVVIETPDAVLVAHKNRAQDVKSIVSQLKEKGKTESIVHQKVDRPWGYYESIYQASGFQVKRIGVYPGQRLSLQMHHHRAEHWVIVKGRARVVRNEETLELDENQSVYIPKEAKHRIENIGPELLEFVEVQYGSYLGEDDIVRFQDDYGREKKRTATVDLE